MMIALIDYGSGNLRSVSRALDRVARTMENPPSVIVTGRTDTIRKADRIVLPGVGAFAACKEGLDAVPDLTEALSEAVLQKGKPFLGICVGMQLMATAGYEHREHPGLNWIPGTVRRLNPASPSLKIPHMGWNTLQFAKGAHPVLNGLTSESSVYFVHSYAFATSNPAHTLATTEYGGSVTALIGRDTMLGAQFHPEKSQAAGLRFLSNFLHWTP